MMRRLESLESWRAARKLAVLVYRLTLEPPLSRHLSLADQIRRAAPPIPRRGRQASPAWPDRARKTAGATPSREHGGEIDLDVPVDCLDEDHGGRPGREVGPHPAVDGAELEGIAPRAAAERDHD